MSAPVSRRTPPAMPAHKYRPFPPVSLPDRRWPSATITRPPVWCSVDLRDGNQALVEPMGRGRKLSFFRHLVEIGFREIEIGFPSASETDFDFVRHLVERESVPGDVWLQVLTQARPELIRRTFEAVEGARNVIIHLYNSTSTLQREVVFGLDRAGIQDIAVAGAALVRDLVPRLTAGGTRVRLEYSPESFTGTELDFALGISRAVMDVWQPTAEWPMILNLPATVEMASPNVYADQIEWMHRNLAEREKIILSLHPHNDRGSAVAAAELGLLAGADRIEGTLFGNGERTGNVDLVTLCLNMLTQGTDPGIDLSDLDKSVAVAVHCNRLPVHERHPYAGRLVHTAFSGSHQDAIRKGMRARRNSNDPRWNVPYLPIDPEDIGRNYEEIIRVNSQSGKGGIAYLLESEYGVSLPRDLQIELGRLVQQIADETGKEIPAARIWQCFEENYINLDRPCSLPHYRLASADGSDEVMEVELTLSCDGTPHRLGGRGAGVVEAFCDALATLAGGRIMVQDYHQDALGTGSDAEAICIVRISTRGRIVHGAGRHRNTVTASLLALTSALNRTL